jgi:putative holliday junction resolvase
MVARTLSLDAGQKRRGIAFSHPSGFTARALEACDMSGSTPGAKGIEDTRHPVRQFEASRVVAVLPKCLNWPAGPMAQAINRFAEDIGYAAGAPVDLWGERFSTGEAHRIFDTVSIKRHRRKGSIDMMAAQIILQGYLDAQGHA